jgi:hypothetical protein
MGIARPILLHSITPSPRFRFPALHQHVKRLPQMFRMREGLKLTNTRRSPLLDRRIMTAIFFDDVGQKLPLRDEAFCCQTFRFAGQLYRREIDVRGDVLFTGTPKQIFGLMVLVVGAQRAVFSFGR